MGGRKGTWIAGWLAIALSAACAPVSPTRPPTAAVTVVAPVSPTPNPTATPTATAPFTPSNTAVLPAYPHLSFPGTEWLRRIFETGRQSGMRSGVFSKVGDSLTANGVFLAPFGTGNYALGEYGYLQEAIDFFIREDAREDNSFVNKSLAAKTGWRAEDVLDPANALPPCAALEIPLDCEYRTIRPAIAVILLGTNDAAAPTGRFEASMRTIIARTLKYGVIPILTTLPDLKDRDVGEYNDFLRDLANQWGIPLIDLSAALEPLPRRGLAPDGIHLSWVEPADFRPPNLTYGMTVRNLLTLQALDAVWRSYPAEEN